MYFSGSSDSAKALPTGGPRSLGVGTRGVSMDPVSWFGSRIACIHSQRKTALWIPPNSEEIPSVKNVLLQHKIMSGATLRLRLAGPVLLGFGQVMDGKIYLLIIWLKARLSDWLGCHKVTPPNL